MRTSTQKMTTVATLLCLLFGTGVAQAMQGIHMPNGQTAQGKIQGGRLMIVGPDHKLHPAADGRYRNAAGQSIIIQGGRIAPGGAQAIGPKPDDPRLMKAIGPKPDDPRSTKAIGPKPDDPRMTRAIGPKPDDPRLTQAIGPKPDDPRSMTLPSAGMTSSHVSSGQISNGGTNLSVAPPNAVVSGTAVRALPAQPAVGVMVK